MSHYVNKIVRWWYLSTSYQERDRLANKNCSATRNSKNPTRGNGIHHFCYW